MRKRTCQRRRRSVKVLNVPGRRAGEEASKKDDLKKEKIHEAGQDTPVTL